ncbi:hypothetical protein AABM17_1905 [Neisseria musculi]|uniref:Uncharacterized protein n=1 Tax=Neisseria musculi TaxID=1815583 RepID=A0A7H1MEC3_9NEIS|nr:hypothetical protein H7A79_1905 [Neisseria musculi]
MCGENGNKKSTREGVPFSDGLNETCLLFVRG